MSKNCLETFTIYYDTLDYPGVYCARRFIIDKEVVPAEFLGTAPTLQEARKLLPSMLCYFARDNCDDAKIVETWI